MKSRRNYWRLARIALAVISFCLLLAALFGRRQFRWSFLTQIGSDIPALLGNFSIGALVALLSVLILTLILGRLYCSVLCPLGIFQDILGHFHRKGALRNTPWKRRIRGPVFVFVVVAAICGMMLPLTLLMPSANFVIICNTVFRGAVQWLFGSTELLAEPITLRPMPAVQITGWVMVVALLAVNQWRGRVFCNTLCPVGALWGVLSRKSYYRVAINQSECVHCGACERICKAGCIDAKAGVVRNDECVMCMNCLNVCPKGALTFGHHKTESVPFKGDRRAFLANGGALLAAGGVTAAMGVRPTAEVPPVMPPGAGTLERFTSRCVGCGICIGACRGKVLKASVTEYGLRGFMQPVLDPYRGACDFNCAACSNVCPCGALTPLSKQVKQTTRIGLAHWEPSRCVAFLDDEACGACAEHCPVGALTMEEVPGKGAKVPHVNPELCIGCGACQNICPVRPVAAIVVHGVAAQCRVEPPKPEESDIKLQAEDDFPF